MCGDQETIKTSQANMKMSNIELVEVKNKILEFKIKQWIRHN